MKKLTVNGREYNIREYLTARGLRDVRSAREAAQGDADIDDVVADAVTYAMLLDANGKQYASIDDALDSIHCDDDLEVRMACVSGTGMKRMGDGENPLAEKTNSDSD